MGRRRSPSVVWWRRASRSAVTAPPSSRSLRRVWRRSLTAWSLPHRRRRQGHLQVARPGVSETAETAVASWVLSPRAVPAASTARTDSVCAARVTAPSLRCLAVAAGRSTNQSPSGRAVSGPGAHPHSSPTGVPPTRTRTRPSSSSARVVGAGPVTGACGGRGIASAKARYALVGSGPRERVPRMLDTSASARARSCSPGVLTEGPHRPPEVGCATGAVPHDGAVSGGVADAVTRSGQSTTS